MLRVSCWMTFLAKSTQKGLPKTSAKPHPAVQPDTSIPSRASSGSSSSARPGIFAIIRASTFLPLEKLCLPEVAMMHRRGVAVEILQQKMGGEEDERNEETSSLVVLSGSSVRMSRAYCERQIGRSQ